MEIAAISIIATEMVTILLINMVKRSNLLTSTCLHRPILKLHPPTIRSNLGGMPTQQPRLSRHPYKFPPYNLDTIRIMVATHPGFYQPSPGFQPNSQTGGFSGGYASNGTNAQPPAFQSPQAAFPTPRGRGQKRGYNEAFGHRGRGRGRGSSSLKASPAVPNFGGPLPLPPKPPAPENQGKQGKKDKRRNNTLGLTPKVKVEDQDSADETEDDENEEGKLAANGVNESSESKILQINYRGQTSVLQSAADLAAWLEERKKKYPTKAKAAEAAEKRRQQQELRKAARDAAMESRRKAIAEQKEKQAQNAKHDKKHKKTKKQKGTKEESAGSEDAAAKAKRRIEDLRRKLEKEERRIAKAEAKISKNETKPTDDSQDQVPGEGTESKKRKRSASPTSADHPSSRHRPDPPENALPKQSLPDQDANPSPNTAPDPLTPLSQPLSPTSAPAPSHDPAAAAPTPYSPSHPPAINPALRARDTASPTPSSSTLTLTPTSDDDEDETSSSGSSSSSDSDSDSSPPETTAKRDLPPQRFPPPPRTNGTQQPRRCRYFVRNGGTCRVGDKCLFKHEMPPPLNGGRNKWAGEGGGKRGGREGGRGGANGGKRDRGRDGGTGGGRGGEREDKVKRMQGRVGLWQRLVEQEKRVERAADRVREAREKEERRVEGGEDG